MFCSWRARQAGDQLIGTAAEASAWLLVEHPHPWKRNAVGDSDLPEPVREALSVWAETVDGLRVQFIRRGVNAPDVDGRTTAFWARPHPTDARLYRARLASPEALLDLDPSTWGEGAPTSTVDVAWEPFTDSLVLTCTHGKRDRCCSRYGNALHEAVREVKAGAAWQTSHLGGHRFAPTCVVLPSGAHYGWLSADDAGAMWTAHEEGDLYRLDRYRGHTGYPRPVQAGAIFLRQVLERMDLGGIVYESDSEKKGVWRVRFRVDDERHEIKLDVVDGDPVPHSCGSDPEPTRHYRLEGHRTL